MIGSRRSGGVTEDKRSSSRFLARVLPGARPAPISGFIEPCQPTPVNVAPSGKRWVHEIKYDGYRIQAQLAEGRVILFTLRGDDWTQRLPRIVAALKKLPVNKIILDGEATVQDANGASDFAALEDDLAAGRQDRLIYYAFDLLHLDGFDIRDAPLVERKRVLASLLNEAGEGLIAFSDHLDVDGPEMFQQVTAMGLAGVVSKLRDAPYRSGRGKSWLTVKHLKVRSPVKRGGQNPPPEARGRKTRPIEKTIARGPLLVVDGDSFAHRAYHGLPKSIRRAGDKGGGAILGFANYLLRLYETEAPRAVLVGWDTLEAPTWRHQAFAPYQSGREFDDELLDQLDVLPQIVSACGFANAKAAGYEADDFLAAGVAAEERRDGTAIVASGDRDAFQLASDRTTIIHPVRAGVMARIGPAEVRERYGVDPKQVPDFIALRGDPSDKLPGAKGVGPKGAASLLQRYPTLEDALADGRFASQAKSLRLYRRIATMDASAPLPSLPDQKPTWAAAAMLARQWELNGLADRLMAVAGAPATRGRRRPGG